MSRALCQAPDNRRLKPSTAVPPTYGANKQTRLPRTRQPAPASAHNMAVVRHFALNLVRQANDKRAIKRRRKVASWNPNYLCQMLQLTLR
jgi:hypothetical protein